MATTYEAITDFILAKLEAGVIPWEQPWQGGFQMPRNLVTQKSYQGINVFLTLLAGYASPYWVGFRQAQALAVNEAKRNGIEVEEFTARTRRGSKKMWRDRETKELIRGVKPKEKGTPILVAILRDKENSESDEGEGRGLDIYFRRTYVWNVEQCQMIGEIPKLETPSLDFEPISAAESIVHRWKDCPVIREQGSRAYYNIRQDEIVIPSKQSFHTVEDYYCTLFHEMGHSTGSAQRLARDLKSLRTSHEYSKEELVAEFCAAFLCGAAGIVRTLDSSASYIEEWSKALSKDPKMIIQAASEGQRAADLILGKE